MNIVNRNDVKAFITKDQSEIREILSYRNSTIKKQSLAEARVIPGQTTDEHYHIQTEEIYYILQGKGIMEIDGKKQDVKAFDGIAIPSGARHRITNIGDDDLIFLCCCVPAYENDDTVVIEK
jgi:mannose-6-phosphate isomerase-like protein (cupin superfamily)